MKKETNKHKYSMQNWLKTVDKNRPTDYMYKLSDSNPPNVDMDLSYIYGYRCHDTRNNVKYSPTGEIVYHTAAVGIVLDH
jgi:microtubule-associated protein-like 6